MIYKKALIINLGGIGDLVISTAFFRNFKNSFSGCHVTALISSRGAELLEGLHYIDEIIAYDLQDVNFKDLIFSPQKFLKSIKLLLKLRKSRYDISVNLLPLVSFQSAIKMSAVFFILGTKIRAGRDTEGLGWFYQIKVKEPLLFDMYDVELQGKLLEKIGGIFTDNSLDLPIPLEDELYIEKQLLKNGVKTDRPLIIVNPGSNWPSKMWPVENFVETIKGLKSKTDASFIVTGSASEIPLAEMIKKGAGDISVLTGKTTLHQLAALLKKTSLFITNDTGPMHLAIAIGTPVVAIFGPGYYKRFFPPDREGIIRKDFKCSPCVKKECNDMGCLKTITPDEVIEKALWLLSRK